jgi:hypothetical protein
MGGTYSAPTDSRTPTILNFIIREMFSRADLVDIYSMADPHKCSKYLVVASDALDSFFVKIRLYPAATKEGTLYFQSIDGLTKGTSVAAAGMRDLRKKYCNQIAFFFVRIFQVFAALTLTMLDSDLPLTDPSDDLPEESGRQRPATFIDPRSFLGVSQAAAAPVQRSWFGGDTGTQRNLRTGPAQRGGSLSGTFIFPPTSPYKVLNYWLTPMAGEADQTTPLRLSDRIVVLNPSIYDYSIGSRVPKADIKPVLVYRAIRTSYNSGAKSERQYDINAAMTIEEVGDALKIHFQVQSRNERGQPPIPERGEVEEFDMIYDSFKSKYVYVGKTILGAENQDISVVLRTLFEKYVDKKVGKQTLYLTDLLKKLGYVVNTVGNKWQITDTDMFYEYDGVAPLSRLPLTFRKEDVTFPGDKTRVKVTISNIGFELKDTTADSTGKRTYSFILDFSKASVSTSPGGFEYYINLPSDPEPINFKEASVGSIYPTNNNRTIPEFFKSKMKALLTNKDEDLPDGTGIQYTRRGLPIPHNSEGIPDALRVKALWKAIAKDPPIKAHCIARATQLLSVAAFRGKMDDMTFSQACRTSFIYQKDGSLPTPGQGVYRPAKDATTGKAFEGEFGILAMAMLFFDRLDQKGMPQFGDSAQYRRFLANLKYAFEKTAAPDYTNPPQQISQITEKLPGGVCQRVGDKPLGIPKPLAGDLRGVTQQLISQQVAHVGKAMELIFELFDRDAIINRRQFALNPTILAGGTPAVNAVANKAKDLLLQYYVNCETTYRSGLALIVNTDRRTPLQAYGQLPAPTTRP